MLPKRFRAFLKNSFIKKDVEKEHQKLKLVKKIQQVCESFMIYHEVYFGTLVLVLHRYSGDKK